MDPMGVNGCNCCRGHFFSGRPRSWWQKGVVLPAAPASFLCWIQEDLQWWSLLVSGLRFISNTSFFGVKKLSGPPNKKMTWLDSMMIMRCDSMFKQWWNLKGNRTWTRKIYQSLLKRRKTCVPSFGRWKPALPIMKPWRFLGYAEMNSFSIGLSGWAVFIWEEASYG